VGPSEAEGPSPGPPVFPYASAAAFRTALRDRFAAIAKTETRYSLDELQRQFAYDRALARLFTAPDAASWVLKGAGALLARLEQARHSKDIDVYFAEQSAAVSDATAALRRALSCDLGDYFGFEVTRIVPLQEEAKGSRVHVRATLGAKTFAVFHIDVVVGTATSGIASFRTGNHAPIKISPSPPSTQPHGGSVHRGRMGTGFQRPPSQIHRPSGLN
jgi:Nucleotidyl transferase AbiEii toxin, Type IV TA system